MSRSTAASEGLGPHGSGVNENTKERIDQQGASPQKADYYPEMREEPKKRKSRMAQVWEKSNLDIPTLFMMMKAGVPPTIALAMYQTNEVADTYSTLGYLVAIVSILGFCIMPRAKFIQTMFANIVATCVGAGVCMLMVWTGVQARLHTTPGGAAPPGYNSSQSAVCGVWLFFQIWLVNSLKAKFPQFAFPAILYSIFVNVAAGYGPQFTSNTQARAFIQRLLECFLTGFALATVVSLVIFPVNCRTVVKKEITGYITALRGTLQAHKNYLQSLETSDVFSQWRTATLEDNTKTKLPEKKPEIVVLKGLQSTYSQLHGKLHGDLPFAKREVAFGKLTPDDLEALFKHLRDIMMPLVGLGSLVDLFDRAAERHDWPREPGSSVPEPEHEQAVDDWHGIMKSIHEPIAKIIQAMDGGLAHVMLKLHLTKPAKFKKKGMGADEEAKAGLVLPGDAGYADYLEEMTEDFYNGKETTLRQWLQSKGVNVNNNFFENSAMDSTTGMEELRKEATLIHHRHQHQLYIVLYIVFILHSISSGILRFVRFADEKDQAHAKSKLIYPGRKRFRKWVSSLFKAQDTNHDDEATLAGLDRDNIVVHLGEAYRQKKDPEHLPPENAWERLGDGIRAIAKFFRSSESSFGFRVACATMSIAIVAFLRDSQRFFIEQRLVWALIMVSISMTPTAGQSVWAFFLRVFGTFVAMLLSWLIWYIPGEQTAGIIVFLWVFVSMFFYIPLKRPDLIIAGLITVVTATLIVGYELEVRKLGKTLAESNGQPAYPIYQLAPYRLATVAGGLAVAFIWTFFPFPISEHSAMRQKLGGALYLSANYYSVVHETVMGRIRGDEGDPTDKTSPAYQLAKARNKVFSKQTLLLQGLKTHASFVRWEFPLGGKFPSEEYDTIIQLVSNITNYSALISYASETFTHPKYNVHESDPSHLQWFRDFRRVATEARLTSHEVTSTLALLSSSITNGQPLPPYLTTPQGYGLAKKLEAIDKDIMSIRHIAEPGYAAFAVLQISTSCITMDLEKLLRAVRKLVGELDFSFHVVSTRSPSDAPSTSSSYEYGGSISDGMRRR